VAFFPFSNGSLRPFFSAHDLVTPMSAPNEQMIYMRFRPAWTYIDAIREFGRSFCTCAFGQTEMGDRVQVVIQEALENVVKYSLDGTNSELTISIGPEPTQIEIAVTSRPDPAHADYLRKEIESIRGADPAEAYLAAFQRAAENPDGASRLGLARMRLEGRVELSVADAPDGRISVIARGSA
jgi:hypothetical protein